MKIYTWQGKTYTSIPDPLKLEDGSMISPVSEVKFIELGGLVQDNGELSPKERVCGAFDDLIADLAQKTDKITPAEFLAAARNGISSDLIMFARARGVPEEVIAEGRARIVEIMADALRFGVSWSDLITGVTMQA